MIVINYECIFGLLEWIHEFLNVITVHLVRSSRVDEACGGRQGGFAESGNVCGRKASIYLEVGALMKQSHPAKAQGCRSVVSLTDPGSGFIRRTICLP
jgi:hypothetical protein